MIVRDDPRHRSASVIDLKLVQGLWSVECVRGVIEGLRPFLREASTVKIDHHYPETQDDEGQGDHGHHALSQVHHQPLEQFHGGNSLTRGRIVPRLWMLPEPQLQGLGDRALIMMRVRYPRGFNPLPTRYEIGCGGLAGQAELLTGAEVTSSRPLRKIVLRSDLDRGTSTMAPTLPRTTSLTIDAHSNGWKPSADRTNLRRAQIRCE